MLSSVVVAGRSIVLGAPDAVLSRRRGAVPHDVVNDLAARGRRVLAVAEGHWHPGEPETNAETGLSLGCICIRTRTATQTHDAPANSRDRSNNLS